MKNIINRVLSVFKRENEKASQFNDLYIVCNSASNELEKYCKMEGLSK